MRRVTLSPRYRGPDTKLQARRKAETTAKLSKETGWGKPLIKLPNSERKSS